jgi:hypothetical protein
LLIYSPEKNYLKKNRHLENKNLYKLKKYNLEKTQRPKTGFLAADLPDKNRPVKFRLRV